LHYPLDYSSHPLDGTLLHCSTDFPLENQAIVQSAFWQILSIFLLNH